MTRWDWVVVGCLGTIAIPALDEPVVLLLLWPVTVVVGAIAIAGTLRGLWPALRRTLPLGRATELRIALGAVIAACLVGAVASVVPVLVIRSSRHANFVAASLDRSVAPVAWAVLLVVAARALRVPSPRRLAAVVAALTAAWPVLLAIRVLRAPFMDIDGNILVLAPWALQTFVACAIAAAALALYLANATRRACAEPEPVLPPRAEVIDR